MTLADRTIRAFVVFRLGFNTRFYYPLLAVLFVDYGLTLEQYTLLNVVWAAAIVGFEVPSGALADVWGRRRLIQAAAGLMVVEMGLLAFAPVGGSSWLFPLMMLNRFLSGTAEAFASGADEALAYDALKEEGREKEWPRVLERLGRWQSIGFFLAMLAGAAMYDPRTWNQAAAWLGMHQEFTRAFTIRLPGLATLGMALVAGTAALRLREPAMQTRDEKHLGTWGQVFETGRWILRTPAVFSIILVGLCLDSVVRLMLTFGSTYYRWIALPDYSFGLLGAGFAVVSFALLPVARGLVENRSVRFNFGVTIALVLVGLIGSALGWKYWGFLFALVLGGAMTLVGFFLSHYLHQWTDSKRRATVLSFKGLAFNLAYGTAGLGFAGLLRIQGPETNQSQNLDQFGRALHWLPWAFVGALLLVFLFIGRDLRQPKAGRAP
jgi:MFS family permease